MHPSPWWGSRRLWCSPCEWWLWWDPLINGPIEIQSYSSMKVNCLITASQWGESKSSTTLSEFSRSWLFTFFLLFLGDKSFSFQVLPGDKGSLLWDKEDLKKYQRLNFSCALKDNQLDTATWQETKCVLSWNCLPYTQFGWQLLDLVMDFLPVFFLLQEMLALCKEPDQNKTTKPTNQKPTKTMAWQTEFANVLMAFLKQKRQGHERCMEAVVYDQGMWMNAEEIWLGIVESKHRGKVFRMWVRREEIKALRIN